MDYSFNHYILPVLYAQNITGKMTRSTNTKGPQKGAVTHHHDQLMYPVSLSATNKTPSIPNTPIPDELLEVVLLTIISSRLVLPKASQKPVQLVIPLFGYGIPRTNLPSYSVKYLK